MKGFGTFKARDFLRELVLAASRAWCVLQDAIAWQLWHVSIECNFYHAITVAVQTRLLMKTLR